MTRGANRAIWHNLLGMVSSPKGDVFPGVVGTFMARDAFALTVSHLDLAADDVVLLPGFLCREVLKPFLGRSRLQFYDVTRQLTVEPDHLRRFLDDRTVRLLVIINYFGFLQPYRREIAAMCAEQGTILLEDCAHSLLTAGSGETGDISIFSFRKTLPVADGGGLRLKPPSVAPLPDYYPQLYSNVLSTIALAKALFNIKSETLSRSGMTNPRQQTGDQGLASVSRRVLPLSSFAKNGIGHASFGEIVRSRRRNYAEWEQLAADSDAVSPVFNELGAEVCPFGFPATLAARDLTKARLNALGVQATIHWRVPPEIGEQCANSKWLSEHMLTFPLSSGLNPRHRAALHHALLRPTRHD